MDQERGKLGGWVSPRRYRSFCCLVLGWFLSLWLTSTDRLCFLYQPFQ